MSNAGLPAARVGDDVATGHGCDATTKIATSNTPTRVIICGEPAATVGMVMEPHTITNPAPFPAPQCIPHLGPVVNAGSAKVKIGGKGLARKGDSADMGTITSGCSTVLAG